MKFLSDSFEYCAAVISSATEQQLRTPHNSPDGRMPGRDVLLAMYVHVAHHRGQAEIYLREQGHSPTVLHGLIDHHERESVFCAI